MAITELQITNRASFASGEVFGEVGIAHESQGQRAHPVLVLEQLLQRRGGRSRFHGFLDEEVSPRDSRSSNTSPSIVTPTSAGVRDDREWTRGPARNANA